jgi:hypothetical protein
VLAMSGDEVRTVAPASAPVWSDAGTARGVVRP